MIVVLAFAPGDVDSALRLLEFMSQLGGAGEYPCLLVADAAVQWSKVVQAMQLAEQVFRTVAVRTTTEPITNWKQGANAMWLAAAQYAKEQNAPFLWLEPDAVPVKRGWLVSIDKMKGDGFFGHVYDTNHPNFPPKVLSGIAVYPPDAIDVVSPRIVPDQAWDISSAEAVLPRTTPTKMIQHFWGQPDLAPTFVGTKTPDCPANAFTLADIWPEAVIFHRVKDGSLIRLLRRTLNLSAPGNFTVVLPFHNADAPLLVKNLLWMEELGMAKTHDCLLSYDRTTVPHLVQQVADLAARVFNGVHRTSYAVPHGTAFPQTAAWHHAAWAMSRAERNWLWFEADCVPLRANWLDVLQTVYDHSPLPFCGPVVSAGMHCNGTAIYPANTPELLPRTMSHTQNAWDVEAKDEMGNSVKDISHIFFCAWGIKDGKLNPLEGECPSFPAGTPLLQQIPKTAVVFHRCKDHSLIDRLRGA